MSGSSHEQNGVGIQNVLPCLYFMRCGLICTIINHNHRYQGFQKPTYVNVGGSIRNIYDTSINAQRTDDNLPIIKLLKKLHLIIGRHF